MGSIRLKDLQMMRPCYTLVFSNGIRPHVYIRPDPESPYVVIERDVTGTAFSNLNMCFDYLCERENSTLLELIPRREECV